MLVAINIALFTLGFITAAIGFRKPEANRKALNRIVSSFEQLLRRWRSDSLGDAVEEFKEDVKEQIVNDPNKNSLLLTRRDVEQQFEPSSWQRLAYDDFRSTLMGRGAKTFPCVYATMGFRAHDHRYVFLESDDPAEPRNIRKVAPALKEYLDISHTLGPNTSIVVIGAPTSKSTKMKTVEDYNNSFWDLLRGLRTTDPKSWPADIPQDTDSEKWMFCFDGQPLFPVMLTPAHQMRWSRHMSVPVIVMQPKWVLDNLLGTPEKRESAQGKVRKLLVEYDHMPISPDLTSYGQPGTSEVRQLCLADENETVKCPYSNFDA